MDANFITSLVVGIIIGFVVYFILYYLMPPSNKNEVYDPKDKKRNIIISSLCGILAIFIYLMIPINEPKIESPEEEFFTLNRKNTNSSLIKLPFVFIELK